MHAIYIYIYAHTIRTYVKTEIVDRGLHLYIITYG